MHSQQVCEKEYPAPETVDEKMIAAIEACYASGHAELDWSNIRLDRLTSKGYERVMQSLYDHNYVADLTNKNQPLLHHIRKFNLSNASLQNVQYSQKIPMLIPYYCVAIDLRHNHLGGADPRFVREFFGTIADMRTYLRELNLNNTRFAGLTGNEKIAGLNTMQFFQMFFSGATLTALHLENNQLGSDDVMQSYRIFRFFIETFKKIDHLYLCGNNFSSSTLEAVYLRNYITVKHFHCEAQEILEATHGRQLTNREMYFFLTDHNYKKRQYSMNKTTHTTTDVTDLEKTDSEDFCPWDEETNLREAFIKDNTRESCFTVGKNQIISELKAKKQLYYGSFGPLFGGNTEFPKERVYASSSIPVGQRVLNLIDDVSDRIDNFFTRRSGH